MTNKTNKDVRETSLVDADLMAIDLTAAELTDAELMRYSRQILLDGWDMDAQLRLKNSRICIIGAGGLGCPVADTLVRAGVGEVLLIDDDVIDDSNLQRQTLFTPADVGQPKAKIAAEVLKKSNEWVMLTHKITRLDEDNGEDVITMQGNLPDLLLDCTDNFATRDVINRLSVRLGVPLLSASAIAMTGQLALYEPYKGSGCYQCVFQGIADDTRTCATSGVLASTTTVMGNMQANAALQYLGLGNNPLAGKLLLWDGRRMTQRLLNYRRDPECVVCGSVVSLIDQSLF